MAVLALFCGIILASVVILCPVFVLFCNGFVLLVVSASVFAGF